MIAAVGSGSPARSQVIRAINERLLLDYIRGSNGISRADLARISGLAKSTVSQALANLERAQLVRASSVRTGLPGPAAVLYEVRPESGYVLALDVGSEFLRGAIQNISGTALARRSIPEPATSGPAIVAELVKLFQLLLADASLTAAEITQTVLSCPGVYGQRRMTLTPAGALRGWDQPAVRAELRRVFGPSLMIETNVDAATLAERAHGHGRDVDSFAFVSIGTSIAMGLVLGGRLHRGFHGAAGEIGYLPLDSDGTAWPDHVSADVLPLGSCEFATSVAGVVRATAARDMREPLTARGVLAAADQRAPNVREDGAWLVARALCAVITVADPQLIVLGGEIGQANGFVDAVGRYLHRIAPAQPELRVSALGDDAAVDGCLAAGLDQAWQIVTGYELG